ncbi:AI-2E family transporter [Methylotenera sp.]|uniref:AI-2E family transporter n=1 Tax=Methylotenera sp. TaxID=2051956 RepID=UPI0024888DAB|nr:AI-2E family transporter [Methylotenera sp.]MDI1298896.1 AI-2E family transporter [Methylotenera sp.]
MLNAKTKFSRRLVPWLALGGLVALASMVVAPFLAPIAWASVLAYASWPVAERIRRGCNNKDTLAAFLATALLALTIFLPLVWLIWLAQQEIGHLFPALQAFLANPPPVPEALRSMPWIGEWLMQQQAHFTANPNGASLVIKTWLAAHTADLSTLAGGLGKNLAKMILVVVILFFFFRDGTRIVRELRHVLERFIGAQVHDYLHAAGTTTRAVVYGILLTALVQGVVAGLGYWVAGLTSPVMFGLLTMILALIPFGTPLAWGAAGLLLLLQGETAAAIGVWIWGAAIVSQLDNVLRPLFISSISPIPFLLVLFGVLGGLLAFGLVGLFIGPIVLSVVWAVWREWTAHLDEVATVN